MVKSIPIDHRRYKVWFQLKGTAVRRALIATWLSICRNDCEQGTIWNNMRRNNRRISCTISSYYLPTDPLKQRNRRNYIIIPTGELRGCDFRQQYNILLFIFVVIVFNQSVRTINGIYPWIMDIPDFNNFMKSSISFHW